MKEITIIFTVIAGIPLLGIIGMVLLHWIKDCGKVIIYLWKDLFN